MRRLLTAGALALLPALALAQSSAGSGGGGGGSGGTVSISNFPATQAVTQSGAWNTGLTGTLPAFASTPTFNVGTIAGIATETGVQQVRTALGSPFQAGGSIGNAAFGISGTLPAFAATPTFNLGTLNGAATATNQASEIALLGTISQRLIVFADTSGTSVSAGATYSGSIRDAGAVSPYSRFNAGLFSNGAGTAQILQCVDASCTSYFIAASASVSANTSVTINAPLITRYSRLIFVNGASGSSIQAGSSFSAN